MIHILMCQTQTNNYAVRAFTEHKTAKRYAEYYNLTMGKDVHYYVTQLILMNDDDEEVTL